MSEEERYNQLLELALNHARHGEIKPLQEMLDHGLPVNLANHEGNTLLMLAAYNEHPDTVQMLLKKGAEPDCRNDRGQTPLGGVAFKGYLSIAKMLLEAGADPLARQGMEMTPLSFSKTFGRTEIQELLETHISKNRAIF